MWQISRRVRASEVEVVEEEEEEKEDEEGGKRPGWWEDAEMMYEQGMAVNAGV